MDKNLRLNKKTEKSIQDYLHLGSKGSVILFGEQHLGKHTVALEIAKILLCSMEGTEACGGCRSCNISLENHPDFFEVNSENETIKIDQIRDMMQHTEYKCVYAMCKVFIIDNADSISEEAQNAMLKILEDESDHCIFILVAHRPLLSTISSRCLSITFLPLEDEPVSILQILARGREGAAKLYIKSPFLTAVQEFYDVLRVTNDRRELIKQLGEIKEKDPMSFFGSHSTDETLSFLIFCECIFMNALYLEIGVPVIPFLKDCVVHMLSLYNKEEIRTILLLIEEHRHRLITRNYNRNDFFDLVISIGGV